MANRPRDLADQMAGQHNLNNGPLHETFTLSVEAARLKAREIIDQITHGGYMTIVSIGGNCQTDRSSSQRAACEIAISSS
jgi:hypothetical protein